MLGTALSHGIKLQQQRNLGSPIASFKACPEKFYWVKRKAAVHGTKVTETRSQKLWLWSGNQNPKGPLLSWQGRLMKRGDKANSEMKHPGIQLVSPREILCLMFGDWGYIRYVLCSCFQPCLQIYFTLWTSLSSTNTSCSLLPQDLCTWWIDLYQVSSCSSSYKSQLNNQFLSKAFFHSLVYIRF